ncbi:MAG: hypothetical protein IKG47_04380 [Oscillospiraceae bacterium]|nr:hypothetical protein [Oscillospiraceae bacterium]
MDTTAKTLLLVLMILYIISPFDACPGPIDDILLAMIMLAAQKKADN